MKTVKTVGAGGEATSRLHPRALSDRLPRFRMRTCLMLAIAVAILLLSLFPLYWVAVCSVREPSVFFQPILLPGPFSLDFYGKLLSFTNYPLYYVNSLVVALLTTLVTVTFGTMMGYVLARYRIRGLAYAVQGMLIGYMLPPMLVGIPLLGIMVALGLNNTLFSLVIGHTSGALPFAVWLLWSFFKTVPFEIEESAMVDGASRIQALLRITLPLALPGVVSVAIFSFIVSWTDFTMSFLLVSSDEVKTVPLGLAAMIGAYEMRWGEVLAGAVLIAVPMLVVFSLVSRYFIRGLTAGAVKG